VSKGASYNALQEQKSREGYLAYEDMHTRGAFQDNPKRNAGLSGHLHLDDFSSLLSKEAPDVLVPALLKDNGPPLTKFSPPPEKSP
jgi:hypothetical protein